MKTKLKTHLHTTTSETKLIRWLMKNAYNKRVCIKFLPSPSTNWLKKENKSFLRHSFDGIIIADNFKTTPRKRKIKRLKK